MDKETLDTLISMLWNLHNWESNHGYRTDPNHETSIEAIERVITKLEKLKQDS